MGTKKPDESINFWQKIPDQSLNKKTIDSLRSHKKEFLILDFWASWCEPCKDSIPFYKATFSRRNQEKFHFVTIGADDHKKDAENFVKEMKIEDYAFWDEGQTYSKLLGIQSLPTLIILDQEGKMIFTQSGFSEKKKAVLLKKLDDLKL